MHKVSVNGSYRLDRVYPAPVGRLALASGATTKAAYRNVVACLDRLAERGRLDLLTALKARNITIAQVLDADRREVLDSLLAADNTPLWPAVEAWLGPAAARTPTMRRYGNSWDKLRRVGVLRADAAVSGLESIDWAKLAQSWPGSAADWNHLRRGVSRFLTVALGDTFHPLRRAILKLLPVKPEAERVPDLDAGTFWKAAQAAPEHLRAAFVAIVALGLRLGEYLRLRPEHLHPITSSVSVPGTKTAGAAAVLRVDPALWAWIVRAVPCPVTETAVRRAWKKALRAVGADPTLRVHDLRHLTAQLLVEAGRSEASVQGTMRHRTAGMTRRYAKQRDHGENATTLARVLLEAKAG